MPLGQPTGEAHRLRRPSTGPAERRSSSSFHAWSWSPLSRRMRVRSTFPCLARSSCAWIRTSRLHRSGDGPRTSPSSLTLISTFASASFDVHCRVRRSAFARNAACAFSESIACMIDDEQIVRAVFGHRQRKRQLRRNRAARPLRSECRRRAPYSCVRLQVDAHEPVVPGDLPREDRLHHRRRRHGLHGAIDNRPGLGALLRAGFLVGDLRQRGFDHSLDERARAQSGPAER